MSDRAERLALLREFREDRWLAHRHLFPHRHPDESPQAHKELVGHINRPVPRLSTEGFRGLAKSTYLEETAVIKAGFREFNFMVLVGSSYDRACDRLASIKREIEINEKVESVFGPLKGDVWQTGQIVLANGLCIRALGREQSMTGMKYLDHRPDAALVDDLEDPEEVRTDPEREKTWIWFIRTFLPSLSDPTESWVRVFGTRRGKGSLPERVEDSGWPTVKFPIYYLDERGVRTATWPSKFPLSKIDVMMADYRGDMQTWSEEYMCEAVADSGRTFQHDGYRVVPRARTWEATYAIYDPARSVGTRSATTGKVVASWIGRKLVVWAAAGEFWMPSQLIEDVFAVNEEFSPIWIGIEEDGLNEWLKEPLRQEKLRRGSLAAIRPLKAPRDKDRFIGQLEPHWSAGEIEFAVETPEALKQFLSFPYGRKDIPNAFAYLLTLRPGMPIYEGFSQDHIADSVLFDRAQPLWLACNATRGLVTAVALQYGMGRTRILADWAVESDASEAVPLILREVGMLLRTAPTACCGAQHYEQYMNAGLVQALSRAPVEVERGAAVTAGREVLRGELGRLVRDLPAVQIGRRAGLTLNALAGGYARAAGRGGGLGEDAEPGLYRVLMEGVEACLGRMAATAAIDENANWAQTADGRRYKRYGNAYTRGR